MLVHSIDVVVQSDKRAQQIFFYLSRTQGVVALKMSILIRKPCAVGSACFSSLSQSQFLNKQVKEKNKLINGKCMCFEIMTRAALLLEPPSRVFLFICV
jgi:hypothetical protein